MVQTNPALRSTLLRLGTASGSVQYPGSLRNRTVGLPGRSCRYATQSTLKGSSGPSRKAVTIASDDGRVRWTDLSRREKAARTTQQSFNFLLILVGVVMTGGVSWFLYKEVFSTDSKTAQFNRAVDRIRKDSRCREILGSGKKIRAYGEPTWNKWARARPIASKMYRDRSGVEHLQMHFNVEGPLDKGVVNLHMVKPPGAAELVYKFLALDVKGQSRIYLENADAVSTGTQKGDRKFFGVRWNR